MAYDHSAANPVTTRSMVMLEIAAGLVSGPDVGVRQAKVLLREQGKPDWALSLYGSGTMESIDAVMNHEADMAIANPCAALMLAHRGHAPFVKPLPVRTIAVIPSLDQMVFAVKNEFGLHTFEDIAVKKPALRVGLRGDPRHGLNTIMGHITEAAGFRLDELKSWGGEACHFGPLPWPGGEKFQALARGEINAIFDEASDVWIDDAIAAGMTILPLAEATVKKLEAMGYRRGIIRKSSFKRLPTDILSIDFSGWPIFVHADLSDERVTQICAALDERKHHIPWQEKGPLPVERMCKDTPETPLDVPLHPAAERFWRARGYL
ncbi:MAG: TAXI family TRAP transporter solute-binding subunit [Burkholderiales bacterium]